MTEIARRFDEEIKSICTRFQGGLSNTSTKKFDELIKIVKAVCFENAAEYLGGIES